MADQEKWGLSREEIEARLRKQDHRLQIQSPFGSVKTGSRGSLFSYYVDKIIKPTITFRNYISNRRCEIPDFSDHTGDRSNRSLRFEWD